MQAILERSAATDRSVFDPQQDHSLVLVAGMAGSGKSSLARAMEQQLGAQGRGRWAGFDGDCLHGDRARQMQRGIGLTDEQRAQFLHELRIAVHTLAHCGINTIAVCSLLSRKARTDALGIFPWEDTSSFPATVVTANITIVWCPVDPETQRRRVAARIAEGTHFFPESLVPGQIAAAKQMIGGREFIGPKPGDEDHVIVLEDQGSLERNARWVIDRVPSLSRRYSA